MRNSLMLGPVPAEESCQQLGTDNYDPPLARTECKQYIRLLTKLFGEPPAMTSFVITGNIHEFGTYYEVEILYDDAIPAAVEYAFNVESHLPATWDAEAIA